MSECIDRLLRKIRDCNQIIADAREGLTMTRDDDDSGLSWYTCAELIELMQRERQRCIEWIKFYLSFRKMI